MIFCICKIKVIPVIFISCLILLIQYENTLTRLIDTCIDTYKILIISLTGLSAYNVRSHQLFSFLIIIGTKYIMRFMHDDINIFTCWMRNHTKVNRLIRYTKCQKFFQPCSARNFWIVIIAVFFKIISVYIACCTMIKVELSRLWKNHRSIASITTCQSDPTGLFEILSVRTTSTL